MRDVNERLSSIVKLNVGGSFFDTSRTTLTSQKDSMLDAMFSGRHNVDKDDTGRYFLDRDGRTFEYVLAYLRSPHTFTLEGLSAREVVSLRAECEYFQLPLFQLLSSMQETVLDLDLLHSTSATISRAGNPKKEAANKKVKAEKKMGGGGGGDPISALLAYAAATASEAPEFGGGFAAQRRMDASNGEKEGQKEKREEGKKKDKDGEEEKDEKKAKKGQDHGGEGPQPADAVKDSGGGGKKKGSPADEDDEISDGNSSEKDKPKSPLSGGAAGAGAGDGGEGRGREGKDGATDDAPRGGSGSGGMGLASIYSDAREDALSAADASAKQVCAGEEGVLGVQCVRVRVFG